MFQKVGNVSGRLKMLFKISLLVEIKPAGNNCLLQLSKVHTKIVH